MPVILLLNPPNPPGTISNKDMMGGLGQLYSANAPKVPPLDIPLTAACLKQAGAEVVVIDCLGEEATVRNLTLRIAELEQKGLLLVGIRTSMPSYPTDIQTAQTIRKTTRAKIVLFGPYASVKEKEAIALDWIDAVILGEPELVFPQIHRSGLESATAITFKKPNGEVVSNFTTDKVQDLNELPVPDWKLLPYQKYILPVPQFPHAAPFLPVQTSRGCPFGCDYCPYPVFQGKRWRAQSPERVIKELIFIRRELGIQNILFRDPEFTLDQARAKSIAELITKEDLAIHWRCETRFDTLNPDLLDVMARAGCCGINFGIEALSQKTVEKSGRKWIPTEKIGQTLALCRERSIYPFCFFILGLPGQTYQEASELIDFAKNLKDALIQFTCAVPYPQTKLAAWANQKGFVVESDLRRYSGYFPVMRNEHLNARQLRRLQLKAKIMLSLRPGGQSNKSLFQRSKEGLKGFLRLLVRY